MKLARRGRIHFAVFALALAAVTVVDYRYVEPFLQEGAPRPERYFLLRTMLAMVLALALVIDLYRSRDRASAFETGWPRSPLGVIMAGLVVLFAVATATLMRDNPAAFHILTLEDSAFEWASAIFLFIGSLVLLATGMMLARLPRGERHGLVLVLLFALQLFFIAMEEVSWFQRVAGMHTPDWYRHANSQGEINLHNLATNQTENAYYMGVFLFLVLMPFVAATAPRWFLLERFSEFIPSRFVLVIGAMSTTFSFGMWNIFWFQFAFFASVSILIAFAVAAWRGDRPGEAVMFLVAAICLVAINGVVLSSGPHLVRSWEDTEFKELFLALGLTSAALVTAMRIWKRTAHLRVPAPVADALDARHGRGILWEGQVVR